MIQFQFAITDTEIGTGLQAAVSFEKRFYRFFKFDKVMLDRFRMRGVVVTVLGIKITLCEMYMDDSDLQIRDTESREPVQANRTS